MNFPAHISDNKAREMAKEHPAMYGHLPRIVTETINQEKAKCLSSSKK